MYGLTVNRTMSLSGHPSIINKIANIQQSEAQTQASLSNARPEPESRHYMEGRVAAMHSYAGGRNPRYHLQASYNLDL